MLLRCTLIFVVVTGAAIGDKNEQLRESDGARVFVLFCFVFEARFCFCERLGKSTVRLSFFFQQVTP